MSGVYTMYVTVANREEALQISRQLVSERLVACANVINEVTAANQGDVDSTPGNGVATEDDMASASLVPNVASLSGVLWIDENRDGVVDGAEQRLSNITVSLLDAAGAVVRTEATGSVGQYYFSDLPPGAYTVSVNLTDVPPGVVQVFDPDGVLDGAFSTQLAAGANAADVNFGFAQDGSSSTTTTTTPSTTTTTPGDLPRTGSDIDVMSLLAGFLLATGGLLLLATRRRPGEPS